MLHGAVIAGSGGITVNKVDGDFKGEVAAAGTAASTKVDIAGSGNVTVTGGAKCDVSKAGSGNVTCG